MTPFCRNLTVPRASWFPPSKPPPQTSLGYLTNTPHAKYSCLSPHASLTTYGQNPYCIASVAVALTQPLVEKPQITRVSIFIATSRLANAVPKNALENCFSITKSPVRGLRVSSPGGKSPGAFPAEKQGSKLGSLYLDRLPLDAGCWMRIHDEGDDDGDLVEAAESWEVG